MDEQPYHGSDYVLPEEHRAFLDAFRELLARYPAAQERFALFDFQDQSARSAPIFEPECFDLGGMRVCIDKERPE